VQARIAIARGEQLTPDLRERCGQDPDVYHVLFLGHCTRAKGLFEAVEGAILAQRELVQQKSLIRLRLTVAGEFVDPQEEAEFMRLCSGQAPGLVEHIGYITGGKKEEFLRKSDSFCFPSHLESFGLVLVEAMAFGLPIVTTRCGALPEVMPVGYAGIVEPRSPDQIARALLLIMIDQSFTKLRSHFETRYTLPRHLEQLSCALKSIETQRPGTLGKPAEFIPGDR
jgi:glycosyltransferase involved in cell wall biosynthesis